MKTLMSIYDIKKVSVMLINYFFAVLMWAYVLVY
mgnify:FL=1